MIFVEIMILKYRRRYLEANSRSYQGNDDFSVFFWTPNAEAVRQHGNISQAKMYISLLFTYTYLDLEFQKFVKRLGLVNQQNITVTGHLSLNKTRRFVVCWWHLRSDPSNLCCPPWDPSTYSKDMWPKGPPYRQMCNLTMLGRLGCHGWLGGWVVFIC